MNGSAANQQQ